MPRGHVRRYGLPSPVPEPGTRLVDCGDGVFAVVDEADWDLVRAHRWSVKNGEPTAQFPAGDGTFTTIQLKAAVLMTRSAAGFCIRNLDGDPLNCRRANLRMMTLAESRALTKKLAEDQGVELKRKPRRELNRRLERPSVLAKRGERAKRGPAEVSVLKGLGEKT